MSAVKLKLMLAQIVKKMCGQHYEYDKIAKLCRDQKFDIEETKVAMAVVEFLLSQSCKHQTNEKVFSKDLLQMGMAIENANAIVKVFVDQGEHIHRVQKQNSMRVS